MVDDMFDALRQMTHLRSAQSRFKNNSLYIGLQLHSDTEIDKFTYRGTQNLYSPQGVMYVSNQGR